MAQPIAIEVAFTVGGASVQTLSINLVDDVVFESDEVFSVFIDPANNQGVTLGIPSLVLVTILDNDGKFDPYCTSL